MKAASLPHRSQSSRALKSVENLWLLVKAYFLHHFWDVCGTCLWGLGNRFGRLWAVSCDMFGTCLGGLGGLVWEIFRYSLGHVVEEKHLRKTYRNLLNPIRNRVFWVAGCVNMYNFSNIPFGNFDFSAVYRRSPIWDTYEDSIQEHQLLNRSF